MVIMPPTFDRSTSAADLFKAHADRARCPAFAGFNLIEDASIARLQKNPMRQPRHSPTPGGDPAGTLFLLLLVNSGGFGILTMQLCLYHTAFPSETLSLRVMVYTVYGLEMAQTVLLSKTMFNTFVYNFFHPDALDQIFDLWVSVPIIGGIVACIVQLFYMHRIVVLRKYLCSSRVLRLVIAVLVTVVSLGQLAGGIALGIEMQQLGRFSLVKTPNIRVSAGTWLGGEALCDIIIAVCMTLILIRSQNNSLSKSTRRHAQKLIRLTIETGLMTDITAAAVAILNLLFVMDNGRKLYYQTSSAAVSKLYSITLLASLNSRMYLASDEALDEVGEISRSLEFFNTVSQPGTRTRASFQMVDVSEAIQRTDRRARFRIE